MTVTDELERLVGKADQDGFNIADRVTPVILRCSGESSARQRVQRPTAQLAPA
ncbi:hypothetical protein AB0D78_36785 [Streptomyces avermitilis]|uniref:hypothetical protein n=1 Tax=Streptomyces avermitilis TaxID=33903 RepID=UPI0033F19A9F